MIDVHNLPPGTPVWLSGALGIALLLLTFSERAAKIKGPLGALARRWENRQIREVERRSTLNDRIESLVDDRVKSETKGLRDALDTLKKQVAALEEARAEDGARIRELEESRDLWAGFSAELTAVLHRLRQWAAEKGLELPERIPRFHEYRDRLDGEA